MNIQAEVDENGVIKITDPNWLGKKIVLQSEENLHLIQIKMNGLNLNCN